MPLNLEPNAEVATHVDQPVLALVMLTALGFMAITRRPPPGGISNLSRLAGIPPEMIHSSRANDMANLLDGARRLASNTHGSALSSSAARLAMRLIGSALICAAVLFWVDTAYFNGAYFNALGAVIFHFVSR